MGESQLERQVWNVVPPRVSQGFALSVDSTARAYDMTVLSWGGSPYKQGHVGQCAFLRLHNDTGSASTLWFCMQPNSTVTLNQTTTIAAAGTLSLQTTFCEELPPGAYAEVRIDREVDKYLCVKATSTATLRVSLASQQSM